MLLLRLVFLQAEYVCHKYAYLKLHETNENYNLYYFEQTDDLIQELHQIIRQGDTVLVKASHGMNFIKIIDYFTKKS